MPSSQLLLTRGRTLSAYPRVVLSLQDWKGLFLEEKTEQSMSNMVAPQTLRREAAGNAPGEGVYTFELRFVLHRIPQ